MVVGKRIRIAEGIYKRLDTKGNLTYSITFTDKFGKLIWKTVGRKSDGITPQYCKQYRSKIINQMRLGEDVSSQRKKDIIVFDDVAQEYIEYSKNFHKNKKGAEQRYRLYIKSHIGHKNIKEITKFDIENIIKLMITKGLKPATVEKVRQTISAIFNKAIYQEVCIKNPAELNRNDNASLIRQNCKNINNIRERYLSKDEAKILLNEIMIRDRTLYLIVMIALTTGARAGEIFSIKFKDIDYDNKFITLSDTKNGENRKIKITPKVYNLISEIKIGNPNEYLIKTSTNKRLTNVPNLYRVVTNKLFNTGLDSKDSQHRVCFHTLRHTFASWLAIDGVPIFDIQKLMGHKDIQQTLRYAKLSPDRGIEAVLDIDKNL